MLDCKEFVNADEIARGLSPFQSDKAAIDAGRLMLHRIKDLIKQILGDKNGTLLVSHNSAINL